MKLTKKQSFIIIGVFFLVALAFTTSLAFFTYSRTGTKRISITAGEVTFSYNEGDSATLATAFPLSDTVGAVDTTGEYLFDVTYNGTQPVKYNVFLVTNNNQAGINYFTNDQIKFALVKNDGFVANTSSTQGLKVSDLTGLNANESTGEGKVLDKQEITTGQTDNYKLRIWISDDVDYTNTIDENGTSTGKYNGYQYSLVVKVTTDDGTAQATPRSLKDSIMAFGVNETPATLTTTSKEANENGLFKSTDTNDGSPTYFFRGNVQNNYLKFANLDWRIIRINEDGTIRIRLANGINNDQVYKFNSVNNTYDKMYYTNSEIKPVVDNWYQEAIGNNPEYAAKVVQGNYFCEQAKVKLVESYTSGNATMTTYTSYTPNFKCATDGNGKGYVNSQVGLITYDELIHAGGYIYPKTDDTFYLYRAGKADWSMSPAAFESTYVYAIAFYLHDGFVGNGNVDNYFGVVPVLNLSTDVLATGTGTSTDPFVIQ